MKKHITAKNPIKPYLKDYFAPLYGAIRITDVKFDTEDQKYWATLYGKFLTDAEWREAGHPELQGHKRRKFLGRQYVGAKYLSEYIKLNFGTEAHKKLIDDLITKSY